MTIEEWAKDFKSYVNELQMFRDDYNGIMEYIDDAIAIMKEQEDFGKELNNAVELIHKKNARIKELEEQIETLTRLRADAGAFD